MEAALSVLNAVGFRPIIQWVTLAGISGAKKEMRYHRTMQLLEEHKIGLFGAITSKPKEKLPRSCNFPSGRDLFMRGPIVTMRQHLTWIFASGPAKHTRETR
jgi:hypothetical protein